MRLADWELTWRDENDAAAGAANQVRTLEQLRKLIRGD
jgi:hypothetical protein